jgi:DNA topoisomerase-1
VSPYTVTEAQAIELIQAKAQAAAAATLATFDGPEGAIVITDGRYGPYIKYSGANYRIAKGTEVSSLDAAACLALIEEQRKNPPKGKRGGRTASKGKKS